MRKPTGLCCDTKMLDYTKGVIQGKSIAVVYTLRTY